MKTLIIDDENLARDNMRILLNNLPFDFEEIQEAGSVLEAIKKYNQLEPNVVFLDINMPNGSGFDFLECVDFKNTKVILVTAYDDFAIKAIKYKVFDYIVKPVDIDVLEATLERLVQEENFVANLSDIEKKDEKIAFSTSNEIVYVDISDIIYCESDNSYCTIHTKSKDDVLISSSLQKVQEKLNGNFFRSHQSFLVNINEIIKYLKLENKILLSNGDKIPVSKPNKKDLLSIFIK